MRALGIDIGSTSIKGAVLDLEKSLVEAPVSCPFPPPQPGLKATWVEIRPATILEAVQHVLSVLTNQAPEAQLLCVSGQMGGLIMLDHQARPLTNYISWRDQRSLHTNANNQSWLDRIAERWKSSGVITEVGQELQPGSTTVLWSWLKKEQQLPAGIPVTVGDFVVASLVKHPIPMHATHAIGMLNLVNNDWHREALELVGLDNLELPQLALTESCVGETIISGRTLRVFGSYGDQQCALRGASLQPDELSLNVSTGSQVSQRVSMFQPGPYQSRKYFFGDTLDTVTHLPAGRSLNVLVNLVTELARHDLAIDDPWSLINQKVAEVKESELSIDLAFFRGPLGERGHIANITTENLTVGSLFHAAFRSMADNYRAIAERFGRKDWKCVVLSGGLTYHAPRLRELISQRFTAPVRESIGEETLFGLLDIARCEMR